MRIDLPLGQREVERIGGIVFFEAIVTGIPVRVDNFGTGGAAQVEEAVELFTAKLPATLVPDKLHNLFATGKIGRGQLLVGLGIETVTAQVVHIVECGGVIGILLAGIGFGQCDISQ